MTISTARVLANLRRHVSPHFGRQGADIRVRLKMGIAGSFGEGSTGFGHMTIKLFEDRPFRIGTAIIEIEQGRYPTVWDVFDLMPDRSVNAQIREYLDSHEYECVEPLTKTEEKDNA